MIGLAAAGDCTARRPCPIRRGAAGAAHAAGDRGAADELLDRAAQLDDDHPSYYGAAWTALARVMLDTDWLGNCG